MQIDAPKPLRRTNQARTDSTRTALINAAYQLFVHNGYANTVTPDIVSAAKVTRGALYHHFIDKADLLFAVALQAAGEVARDVAVCARDADSPLEGLMCGAEGYFAAMADGGRAHLLLVEVPSFLNPAQRLQINALTGAKELEEGLMEALPPAMRGEVPLAELTALVSAAFDQAALAIANGASAKRYKLAMRLLLTQLTKSE